MLSQKQIREVYRLLDHGMVEIDCGVRCEQFCCTGAAVKYLLPGEFALFTRHHPDVPVARKPWYDQVVQGQCCCVREHRMFACRAFPFRPVLEATSLRAVDLRKVRNPVFAPCWIESPGSDWRERAIEAWTIVLSDRDNRVLYGRIQYLRELLDGLGDAFYDIPDDQIDSFFETKLSEAGRAALEARCRDYFAETDPPAESPEAGRRTDTR